MDKTRIAPGKTVIPFLRMVCLSLIILVSFSGSSRGAGPDNDSVIAFFHSVEDAFRNKDIHQIMQHIHKHFYYIMTYSTDGQFSFLVSDAEKYRASVGSFFLSKPKIYEYSIMVDDIQRSGEDILVLTRLKSVVELDGIINSCEANSNYVINYFPDGFLIRDVRGDATCVNTTVQ